MHDGQQTKSDPNSSPRTLGAQVAKNTHRQQQQKHNTQANLIIKVFYDTTVPFM